MFQWLETRLKLRREKQKLRRLMLELRNADWKQLEVVIPALCAMGESALNPLLTMLGESREPEARGSAFAAKALGELGDVRAVESLVKALADNRIGVRQQSTIALGMLADGRALEPLLSAFTDSDVCVRRFAIEAVGKLGDERAVDPLLAQVFQKGSINHDVASVGPDAATLAVNSLGALRCPRAAEALLSIFKHDHLRKVMDQAVQALVNMGATAGETVLAALKDSDSRVRRYASQVLIQRGDERGVVPFLVEVLPGGSHFACSNNVADARANFAILTSPLVVKHAHAASDDTLRAIA